jgi:hypothetical protein
MRVIPSEAKDLASIARFSPCGTGTPACVLFALTPNVGASLRALALYPDRAELKREYPEFEEEDIRQALAFAVALS